MYIKQKNKIYKKYNSPQTDQNISKSLKEITWHPSPNSPIILHSSLSRQHILPVPDNSLKPFTNPKRPISVEPFPDTLLKIRPFRKSFQKHITNSIILSFEQVFIPDCRIEACRVIKKWVKLAPSTFPLSLCAAIVALAESETDDLKEFAQELLRILSIKNCQLVASCGGLQTLIKSITDTKCNQTLCENIALTLSFLLNEPQTRDLFNNGKEILRIFSVFIEQHEGLNQNEKRNLIQNLKKSIVLMTRSWAGLIFLTQNGLQTLIKSLSYSLDPWIKEQIIDMIYEMVNIRPDSLVSYSLINNYLAILIKSLFHSNIDQVLIRLIESKEEVIRGKSRCLAKILAGFADDLIPEPPVFFSDVKEKGLATTDYYPSKCSILTTGYFIKDSMIFLGGGSCLNSIKNKENEYYEEFIRYRIDEPSLLNLIAKTKVHKAIKKWNWSIILELLSGPLEINSRFALPQCQEFIQSLLGYFTPSKNNFHLLPWHPLHFIKAKVGRTLIELLLTKAEGCSMLTSTYSEGFFQTRKSFMTELSEAIEEELKFLHTKQENIFRVLSSENVKNCMAREYFSWVGLFLNSSQGSSILQSFGITNKLLNLYNVDHLALLLIPLLDYRRQEHQSFIEILLNSNYFLRVKTVEFLTSLFRAGYFDLTWAVGGLKSQLASKNPFLVASTLYLLGEITLKPSNLQALIAAGPQELFSLGKSGKKVLMRFFTCDLGVEYLELTAFIKKELEHWHKVKNLKYARSIELEIEKGLDPPKEFYSLVIPLPATSRSMDGLNLTSKLPITVLIGTKSGKRVEVDPIIESNFDSIELVAEIKFPFYLDEKIGAGLKIGLFCIDFFGNERKDEQLVWCSKEIDGSCFQKEGVTFCFSKSERPQLVFIKFKVKILSRTLKTENSKKHLFGELSKTKKGIDILLQTGWLSEYCLKLSKNYSTLEKRSFLWALGHTGSTDFGAKVLTDLSAIQLIVNIAETSPILSLRGTAFQTLSLICRSQVGKDELVKMNWICNSAPKASIALPISPNLIFSIEKNEVLPFNDKLSHIEKVMEKNKLSKSEKEVLKLICSLNNITNRKNSEQALINLRRNSPGLFLSQKLFNCVLEHLSVYKFGFSVRKFIHRLFDLIPLENLNEFEEYQDLFNIKYT